MKKSSKQKQKSLSVAEGKHWKKKTRLFNLENFHILEFWKILWMRDEKFHLWCLMNFCSLCFLFDEALCETQGPETPFSRCVVVEWHLSFRCLKKTSGTIESVVPPGQNTVNTVNGNNPPKVYICPSGL